MSNRKALLIIVLLLILAPGAIFVVQTAMGQNQLLKKNVGDLTRLSENNHLVSLWTSADPEVAEKVCFMYTHNAKKQGWFPEVTLIVWGPSAQLLATNSSLQTQVQTMLGDGVIVQACKACADMYGVASVLQGLGVDVKYMGVPLTNMLQAGRKVLTF